MVACCFTAASGAYTFSASQPSEYSASAQLLFRDPGLDQKLFGNAVFQPSIDPAREAETNLRLVDLQVVADRVAKRLDTGLTGKAVRDKLQTAGQGRSDLVSITATDVSPAFAAELANEFARTYIDFRREADRVRIREAQNLVKRELRNLPSGSEARRIDLERRAEQLGILGSLQSGNAELVQSASVPTDPSAPRPGKSAALGGFFGLILGFGLAYLLGRLDHALRRGEEVEEIFGYPLLASVPMTKSLVARGGASPSGAATEAFRMLCANIRYFNVDREIGCVLVSSAGPEEGKTTVAINLACASAFSGARTLLIEADLRRPVMAGRLNLRAAPGLSDLLSHDASLETVVRTFAFDQSPISMNGASSGEVAAGPTADVIVAGTDPPNPAGLLASETMKALLKSLVSTYDLVIVDTAPLLLVADSIALIPEVDGVIVVSRIGRSTREQALRLRDQLERLNAPVLGVVANAEAAGSLPYADYGYGYGYDRPELKSVANR